MDSLGETPAQRARNEEQIIGLVPDHPDMDRAGLRLLLAPNTVPSAVRRGVVNVADQRRHPSRSHAHSF